MQAMLATQLNHMCESGEVEKNTIIKVTGFALNPVKERKSVHHPASSLFL